MPTPQQNQSSHPGSNAVPKSAGAAAVDLAPQAPQVPQAAVKLCHPNVARTPIARRIQQIAAGVMITGIALLALVPTISALMRASYRPTQDLKPLLECDQAEAVKILGSPVTVMDPDATAPDTLSEYMPQEGVTVQIYSAGKPTAVVLEFEYCGSRSITDIFARAGIPYPSSTPEIGGSNPEESSHTWRNVAIDGRTWQRVRVSKRGGPNWEILSISNRQDGAP